MGGTKGSGLEIQGLQPGIPRVGLASRSYPGKCVAAAGVAMESASSRPGPCWGTERTVCTGPARCAWH